MIPASSRRDEYDRVSRLLDYGSNSHLSRTSTISEPSSSPAWPSVPFSSLMAEVSKSRSTTGSPQLAVNGISKDIPTFRSQTPPSSSSPGGMLSESEIRKRELAEQESLYSASSLPKSPLISSPVFPMSPDPFRRFSPPAVVDNPTSATPNLQQEQPASDVAKQRRPSKEKHGTEPNQTTSSRFSADSITVNGEPSVPKNRATLINVKSFKNLWRKSNKPSISGHIISPPVPVPSPPPLLAAPVLSEQSTSERLPPSNLVPPQHHRADSALDRLHFDQDSRYPVRRSPASTRPTTPITPSLPDKEDKERNVRKSILKSWKSSSVSLSPNPSQTSEPRSSVERLVSKSRRPSLLSLASGSPSLNSPDLPPSPHIPQHFIVSRPNGSSDRRQSAKSRLTESPVDSLYPRSPPTPPRGVPPPRSHSVASSRASDDTRFSFDTSQFEMVSPKLNPSLAYPYHGLDHPR